MRGKNICFGDIRRKAVEALTGNWFMFAMCLILSSAVFLFLVPANYWYAFFNPDAELTVWDMFMLFLAVSIYSSLSFTFTAAMYAVIFCRNNVKEGKVGFLFGAANALFGSAVIPILLTKVLFAFLSFLCSPVVYNRIYELLLINIADYTYFSFFMYILEIISVAANIYVSLAYILTPCVIADHPSIGGITAMRVSRELMRKKKFNMLLLMLYFWPWYILGTCLFIIGAFFAEVCFLTTVFIYYRECVEEMCEKEDNKF